MFSNLEYYSQNPRVLIWAMPLVIFDLIMKGMALWRASKRTDKWWFIAILVINTVGILPVIYLLTHKEQQIKK